MIKLILPILALTLMLDLCPARAWSGATEDAVAAYNAKDYPRALRLAEPQAKSGDRVAQYYAALLYSENLPGMTRNAKVSLSWLRKSADQGYADAQFVLARNYQHPESDAVRPNPGEAYSWALKAAQQGHAAAQAQVGAALASGDGATRDLKAAVDWLRKSVAQNNRRALFLLGGMYQRGEGVPKDKAEALRLYQRAAKLGHPGAQQKIKSLGPVK